MKWTIKSKLSVFFIVGMAAVWANTVCAAASAISSTPDSYLGGTDEIVSAQSSISLSVGADETQMNFTWYYKEDAAGRLYLAKQSDLVNGEMPEGARVIQAAVSAANKSGYYSNQAVATALERGTAYAYMLENGNDKSKIMTFTVGEQGAYSFAYVGDPQIGAGVLAEDAENWDKTLNIISSSDYFKGINFMLSAGDQAHFAENNELFERNYDGYLEHSVLESLPVAAAAGNHDNISDSYNQHFNVPNASAYGISTAGRDYYFIYNGTLFLVLNSNNPSAAEHKAFMESAIVETAGQNIAWKIVLFHHSIYSAARHAEDSDVLQRRSEMPSIFKELDIDVVLMGHDHVYCRTYMMDGSVPMTDTSLYDDTGYFSITNPDGILYVTANSSSGSKQYDINTDLNLEYAAVVNQEHVPNVSRIDVSEESFIITTYRTSDMSVVDAFAIYHPHIHEAVAVEAVYATCSQEGSLAYWYCGSCGKYFSDANCTNEILDLNALIIPAARIHIGGIGKRRNFNFFPFPMQFLKWSLLQ